MPAILLAKSLFQKCVVMVYPLPWQPVASSNLSLITNKLFGHHSPIRIYILCLPKHALIFLYNFISRSRCSVSIQSSKINLEGKELRKSPYLF